MTTRQYDGTRPVDAGIDRYWMLHLIEGAILVLLGIVAVFLPLRVGIALLWWLFLIGGAAGLVTTLVMRRAPGFWWSLLSALLALAIAILLLAVPELAIVGLPLLLMTFLVVEGVATIMLALDHWRALSGRWAWMLASGIVDLLLAVFIVIGLPWTATWALGLILAVNLIFGGGAMVGMALAARDQAAHAQAGSKAPATWPRA
jgi:uncharacterized membrane protein HdeD (DUF308 family)